MSLSTHRFERILEHAAQGSSDEEIAIALDVGLDVIETAWKRLCRRHGVSGRDRTLIAHLCEKNKEQAQALASETARRENAERRLKAVQDELLLLNIAVQSDLTVHLTSALREVAIARSRERVYAVYEEATRAAHAVAYEIGSVDPIVFRHLSPSAGRLGIDVGKVLSGETTFYDIWAPEDLHEALVKMAGRPFAPGCRYFLLYRVRTPRERWVLDSLRPVFGENGELTKLVGMAIDVDDLVRCGIIAAKVEVIAVPDPPPPLPDFEEAGLLEPFRGE